MVRSSASAAALKPSVANQPHHLLLDRLYIHGHSQFGSKRGIALNSADTSILNSQISNIKGQGIDTQAICGWNGPGPYLIENNFLEASGENIMFGGASPAIQGLVPANITIRRNLISKYPAWQKAILATPSSAKAAAVDRWIAPRLDLRIPGRGLRSVWQRCHVPLECDRRRVGNAYQ